MKRRDCPGCRRLQKVVDLLQARVRELEARLGQNAANSSLPPSANPPAAPKPVVKEPTGRSPGAQPGHTALSRVRLPAERLHAVVAYLPEVCRGCQQRLPAQPGPKDPEPTWHQVAELPEVTVRQAEHKNADETGWKLAGRLCWLWAAVSDRAAFFTIHPRRGREGLRALLGEEVRGVVTTDRWCAYRGLGAYRRQLCWAHLVRD